MEKIDSSMAMLAHAQGMLDHLAPKAAPAPAQAAAPAPQEAAPKAEEPKKQEPSKESSLEGEAQRIKELNDTIGGGFEAVSKLADAIKEVSGVKKNITQRLKDTIRGKE